MLALYKSKRQIFLVALVALLFLLTGCGTLGLADSSTTPAQTLQKSATAMSQLKSVHFDLQGSLKIQSASSSTGSVSEGLARTRKWKMLFGYPSNIVKLVLL